ncbi:CoA transferase [Streptomyces sp. NBC_00986]|uniref:CoA transferase n=1 Tax=Streptomyces sp. NBC_00986 TaxID=2903702 RepID=UPI0038638EB5|nr:CoA transferase [Streptomyces sp. NBC_00986]
MENHALRSWMDPVEPFLAPLADVARSFTDLTGVAVDLPTTLFLRAQLAGLERPGRTSANGSCHLLQAADGWAAVNLARPDDLAAVPALLVLVGAPDEPGGLHTAVRRVAAAEAVEAAKLLGIAAAVPGSAQGARPAVHAERFGERRTRAMAEIRIVDFSALWAGPLCARFLGLAGARVLKVESATRPDGARFGTPAFYRWLHEGHDNLVVDFAPGTLDEIVAEADVVIEASRPRALRRLGLSAEEFLAARPGRVWVGITGYGRENDRIAFGDDAAVAGGLTGVDPNGDPVFLGDALADPVTGVFAAEAVARSLAAGGGELLCVSMAACAATLADARAGVQPPC